MHYPQFSNYKIQDEGFSWLWYYSMQQMGDDESRKEREIMYEKIKKREQLSLKIAKFFPPLLMQLSMNRIAKTSLTHQVSFLNATSQFHEDLRLQFYPKIFNSNKANTVDWKNYKPKFFKHKNDYCFANNLFYMISIIFFICIRSLFKIINFY